MSTGSPIWTAGKTQVAGTNVHLIQGGTGDPILVLHDEKGQTSPLRYAESLAQISVSICQPTLDLVLLISWNG